MPKDTPTPKTHGPDNNKRLAQLESGVSALALTLTANGFEVSTDANVFDEAGKAIASLLTDRSSLNEQLHNLAGFASATLGRLVPDLVLAPQTDEQPFAYLERLTVEAEPRIAALTTGDATEGEIAAIARADAADARVKELEAEVAELTTDVEEITSAKNALANQLAEAGQGSASSDAQPEADEEEVPAAPRERPESARDVGPEYNTFDVSDLIKLKETDVDATFELVFSNGEFEIVGIDPIALAASCLVETEGRLKVNVPVQVRGRGAIEPVHGAGLLLVGEQVAYCAFDRSVDLHPGEERRFDHSLIFG